MKVRFFYHFYFLILPLLVGMQGYGAEDVLFNGQSSRGEISAELLLGFLSPEFVNQFNWTIVERFGLVVGHPKQSAAAEVFSVLVDPTKKIFNLVFVGVPAVYGEMMIQHNRTSMAENEFRHNVWRSLPADEIVTTSDELTARILNDEFRDLGYGREAYQQIQGQYPSGGLMSELIQGGNASFFPESSDAVRAYLLPEAIPGRYNSSSRTSLASTSRLLCKDITGDNSFTEVVQTQETVNTNTLMMDLTFKGQRLKQGQKLATDFISALKAGKNTFISNK